MAPRAAFNESDTSNLGSPTGPSVIADLSIVWYRTSAPPLYDKYISTFWVNAPDSGSCGSNVQFTTEVPGVAAWNSPDLEICLSAAPCSYSLSM